MLHIGTRSDKGEPLSTTPKSKVPNPVLEHMFNEKKINMYFMWEYFTSCESKSRGTMQILLLLEFSTPREMMPS